MTHSHTFPPYTGSHYCVEQCFRYVSPDVDANTARQFICDAFALASGAPEVLDLVLSWQSEGPHSVEWLQDTWSSLRAGWEINSGRLEEAAAKSGADLTLYREIDGPMGGQKSSKPVLREVAGRAIIAGWAEDKQVVASAQRFEQALLPDSLENACLLTPLIDGVLDLNCLSVMYGAPGCGKTFLALDMANSIASGSAWNGAQVTQGLVLYIAAEGAGGIFLRTKSLRERRSPYLQVISDAVNLLDVDRDVMGLIRQIKRLERKYGPTRLIVFDTLARCLHGADENSNATMSDLTQVTDLLRDATGAHVMLIHHSGKVANRGMRGHSGLLGACDTALRLVGTKDVVVNAEKQKDLEERPVCAFRLKSVAVEGANRSSACVEYVPLPSCSGKSPDIQGNNLIALNALNEFLDEHGEEVFVDHPSGENQFVKAACRSTFTAWGAEHFDLPDTSRKRRALNNALNKLEKLSVIATSDDYVWLVDQHIPA